MQLSDPAAGMVASTERASHSRSGFQATDWAFIVVVVAAYISLLVQPGLAFAPSELTLLLGLGLLYVGVGTYVFNVYIFSSSLKIRALYFVFQLALSTGILLLGELEGALWLLWLPLISHSAVLLRRWGIVAVCGAVLMLFGVLIGIPNGWQAGVSAALSFSPGVVFVVIFTQVTLNESRARTEVERLARDLQSAHEELARYAVQVEELATAKERNRLAREIHDSLGHYLTAINIQLEAARAVQVDSPEQLSGVLERAQALTKEGLQEVRRSVAALRASPLEGKSLPLLLETLVEDFRASGITAACTITGAPRPLPPAFELALYRAAQEALTNVRKHAQAQRASVTLTYAADSVHLRVEDDGIGSAEHAGGFGLVGLRERVQLLGGVLEISSAPGAGFALDITLQESPP